MASSRIVSRLLVPATRGGLSLIGHTGGPTRTFFYRNSRNLPEIFLGSSANVFRDLEREFERMQRQFDHVFRGGASNNANANDNRALTNYTRGATNGKRNSRSSRAAGVNRVV